MLGNKNLYLYLITFYTLTGCGGAEFGLSPGSSAGDGDEGVEYSGESLEGGAVTQLDVDESGEAEVDLSSLTGSEEFVLALHAYEENGNPQSFEVSSLNDPPGKSATKLLEEVSEEYTEDWHETLREAEADLDPSSLIDENQHVAFATQGPDVGSTRTFKVLNSLAGVGTSTTINATLVHKTSGLLGYVQEGDEEAVGDKVVDLLDKFDSQLDDLRDLYGPESDEDGNGRVIVLFTHVVNEMTAGSGSGGIITGFFYAGALPEEIIFTFVPDGSGKHGTPISESFSYSNIYPTVLPHEWQHIANYNHHVLVNEGETEKPWLNEACSHLAEGISTMDSSGYMEDVGVENYSRFAIYLKNPAAYSMIKGASLPVRGFATLALRFAYEQAEKGFLPGSSSGAELLQNLVDTDLVGVENFVRALYGEGVAATSFLTFLGQLNLALFMDDTGLTNDPRLNFDIHLRGAADDNRGTYLQGPAVSSLSSFPVSGTVLGGGMTYYQLSGQDIIDAGGVLLLNVNNSNPFGAYLIQTGL